MDYHPNYFLYMVDPILTLIIVISYTQNLLFVTEYVQLKAAMLEIPALRGQVENESTLHYNLALPSSLPESMITKQFKEKIEKIDVKDIDKVNEICWDAMNQIYEKYVDEDTADLEVNISHKRRRTTQEAFGLKRAKTLRSTLRPLEKSVVEISSLLNDSRYV